MYTFDNSKTRVLDLCRGRAARYHVTENFGHENHFRARKCVAAVQHRTAAARAFEIRIDNHVSPHER